MLARHHQRLRRLLAIGGVLTALPAAAGPILSAPGRSLQIKSCTADPAAACWESASAITRFAAPPRQGLAPLRAEVRLARQGQALLVRARGLPDGATLEVTVGKNRTGSQAESTALVAGEGLHRLDLGPTKLEGTIRTLWVHLRQPAAGLLRTWAPHGLGDIHRPGSAWFSDAAPQPPLSITETDGALQIDAPGSVELRVVQRRTLFPSGGRGIPGPWSKAGKAQLKEIRPPQTGWYDVTAIWRGPGGVVRDLQRREIYHRSPGAKSAESLGIHPAPQVVRPAQGAPFVLGENARVCTGQRTWRPVMRLARSELERLTGRDLRSGCKLRQYKGGIRLVKDETLPEEGFRIRTTADHVEVAAHDLRGALYGAMAAVDGLGRDGQLPAGEILDAPAIPWRILHHRVVVDAKTRISPETYMRFLRRAVVRGRYNTLVLDLSQGYRWASHPELARHNAWTRADLERVLEAARSLGLEVLPGISAPSHAEWITRKYPDLMEDGASTLLCTRRPETRELLGSLMSELIDVFDQPRYLHIGHDELWWRTHRKHETERCPRCAGSPRWQLVLDDLRWHHEWLAQRGVKPMMWSDMLVKGWHGKNGSIYRAAVGLPEAVRRDFVVVSWTRVGDSVGTLVPMDFPVVRGHTGYHDWKRAGLVEQAKGLTGEALALYFGLPWSSFGGQPGPTTLGYHWPKVILAGTTAWRPVLSTTNIQPTLDHLASAAAYLPGYQAMPGKPAALPLQGTRVQIDAVLPDQADVLGAPFQLKNPSEHHAKAPLVLEGLGRMEGLSLLQALAFDQDAERRLIRKWRQGRSTNGVEVVQAEIVYADGERGSAMLRLGMDTERASRPVSAHLLWRGSGRLRVPSVAAGALNKDATDRSFSRWDWINPRPTVAVDRITFKVTSPGVRWQVLGATTWTPSE